MRKNNLQISVGIAALNEEKKIGQVLVDLVTQHREGWEYKEIVVHSDGSIDATASIVEEFASKYPFIRVVKGKRRKGKIHRVNQMLANFDGDIFVMVDADLRLGHVDVISALIEKFKNDPKTMLVGGHTVASSPKNFIQRAIYTSYDVHYKARRELKGGNNVYGCPGGCMALRREYAQSLRIPSGYVEDTYIYFTCVKRGLQFRHAQNALVTYQLAQTQSDFLKQMFRTHPEAVHVMQKEYFGSLIKKEYRRPRFFYIKSVLEVFVRQPLETTYMVCLTIVCKPLFPIISGNYKAAWFTAKSTK